MDYRVAPPDPITGAPAAMVQRLSDGGFIPFDADNRDYRAYLQWLALGNQPQPAQG
jgi:hypothetical protein